MSSWSSFYDNGFIWNPALTARWTATELSFTNRQEWTGFKGAPQYSTLGFQFPIYRYGNLVRSSFGAFIDHDKVGPLTRSSAGLTYAYHLTPQLMGYSEDFLSLGFSVQMGRNTFDPAGLTSFDGVGADPGLIYERSTSYKPNLTLGLFYKTSAYYDLETHYFGGISYNQVLPGQVINDFGLKSVSHLTLHGGMRYFAGRESATYFEPNVMVIYSFNKAINAALQLKFEMLTRFWLATGVASNGEIFGQAGVILDSESFMAPLVQDGALLVGLKCSYNMGRLGSSSGVGYEGYLAYRFDLQ